MPKLFPPGYWPAGYVDGALSGDEGGAAFRDASATITAGGTVTATASATSSQAPATGGGRRRHKLSTYWPLPEVTIKTGRTVNAAALVLAGSGTAAKITATAAATAQIDAGGTATGTAEAVADYTEIDNAFWAMAA